LEYKKRVVYRVNGLTEVCIYEYTVCLQFFVRSVYYKRCEYEQVVVVDL